MRKRLISYHPHATRKLSFGVTQIATAVETPNKNVSYEQQDNKEGRAT